MATDKENQELAAKYVEARVSGQEPRTAARVAGYSDKTHISQIERPGGPVDTLMSKALTEKGITEDFIASEYLRGIELSLKPGADSVDCQAHAKYLLQLGYLRGWGNKSAPQVAVQINNGSPAQSAEPHDLGRIEDALRETRELLAMVREELGAREAPPLPRESDPVAGGDQLHSEAGSHPGLGPTGRQP